MKELKKTHKNNFQSEQRVMKNYNKDIIFKDSANEKFISKRQTIKIKHELILFDKKELNEKEGGISRQR